MSPEAIALLGLGVTVGAFVQGAIGVGFALVVAPLTSLLAPALLPATVLLLMLPLNGLVIWREPGRVEMRSASLVTAGRVAGAFGGLALLVMLSPGHLNISSGLRPSRPRWRA